MTHARDERRSLCSLLDEVGPDAPTLCAGWTALDLASHLVLRERRPDAAVGIMARPLAGHTRAVQRALAERTPYRRLVEMVRNGPPRMSLFGLPGMDERANVVEFFVHHEDVRRARAGWEPREIEPGLAEVLWGRLKMARLVLRKAPVGVELARDGAAAGSGDDGGADGDAAMKAPPGTGVRITARAVTPMVTVTGTPAELTMWTTGRTAAARVRIDGSEEAVRALSQARWRL